MDTLSVCIIAKNEENNIARCLSSVEDIADEIIVVDTGSTDNTVLIAQSFGAKVIYHEFNNDFGTSRNKALESATMDWILYLDCDEALDLDDSYRLKSFFDSDKYEGFCLSLINVIGGKKQLSLPSLRVFKNRPEYRFEGKIHEQIFPSIDKIGGYDSVHITDIKFYHYGYDENYSDIKSKIKRNLTIFNSFEESEKDGFFYYNLGNEYLRVDNLEEALKCYLEALKDDHDNGYKIYLPIYIVKALHGLKRYEDAISQGEIFLKQYPNYKDLHFILSACFYDLGMYAKCKQSLLNYIEYSKVNYGYPEFHFEGANDLHALLLDLDNKIANI